MSSGTWKDHVDLGTSAEPESQTGGLVESARRIGELEQVVAHLVAHIARTDRSVLQQDTIRRYLGMSESADAIQAINHAKDRLRPLGMLDCDKCGAKVRDMPGFTDERCILCGHLVGSER